MTSETGLWLLGGVAALVFLSKQSSASSQTSSNSLQQGAQVTNSVLNDTTSPEYLSDMSLFGPVESWAVSIEKTYPAASDSIPRLTALWSADQVLNVDGYGLNPQQQNDILAASVGGAYPRTIDGITFPYPNALNRLQMDLATQIQKVGYNELRQIPQLVPS